MKRKTLWIVLSAIVVLLILFAILKSAVNNGLGSKIEAANDRFFEGDRSIGIQLENRLAASDELQNLAAKYDQVYTAYSDLRNTRNELYAQLSAEPLQLGRVYDLNEALSESFVRCREALEPLAEGKAKALLTETQTAMDEAQAAINASDYNRKTEEFHNAVLNRFPNSLLRGLCQAEAPGYWQSESK